MERDGAEGAGKPLACVYVADRGFLTCTCFSIRSLVEAATFPVEVYLLHVDVPESDLVTAQSYLASAGASVHFIALDAAEIAALPNPANLPKATYGRLLMHRYLPGDLDRVLYIDGDTLVDIDVAPLVVAPLNGALVGAVVDVGRILVGRRAEAQERLDLGPDGDYFNAGVMLIDWPAWCAEDVGEKCLRTLAEEPHRFLQKDQCVLNYICRGRWTPLDLVWNYQPASIFYEDKKNAIFHFLGGRKPWQAGHLRHPIRFAKRYHAFYAQSPWAAWFQKPLLPYFAAAAIRWLKRGLTLRHWRDAWRYRQMRSDYGF